MNSVYIISGPPGVGKSTISLDLSKRINKSAYIDGDYIYHQVVNGYVSPWEEGNHLDILYRILIYSTNLYIENGYNVIIDYFLDYEDYLKIKNHINCKNINYYVLLADNQTIINRDSNRDNSKKMGNRVIDAIKEIEGENIPKEYIIDTSNKSIEEVIICILKKQ